ncbi:hypothetical protein N136_04124 [Leifsonia aquatica ATCC 14665]|uniref:DUF4190 domain-containing protein n=1 Tax=Leifsonia aquatica ATCC 14665 TaxID=1358026 RepID=U2RL16_LEIAQ|nr:hypothetical protein N136_04124 [Leifsonia aquatica ATCC 14665]
MDVTQTPGAAVPKTNTFALIGFIAAFVIPVVGIVLSAIGMKQTRITGEGGRGLARAGVFLGSLFTLFQVGFFIVWASLFFGALSHMR